MSVGCREAEVASVKSGPVDGVCAIMAQHLRSLVKRESRMRSACIRPRDGRGIGITRPKVKDRPLSQRNTPVEKLAGGTQVDITAQTWSSCRPGQEPRRTTDGGIIRSPGTGLNCHT